MKKLSDAQKTRYDRTIKVPEIGIEGQKRLARGRVLVVGAGGLGSPAILYLAAAGVGTLGIADHDRVDMSNLNRQIIHFTDDIGEFKTASAESKVAEFNPHIKINQHTLHLDEHSIDNVLEGYQFVIDATDSFISKFLINDACVRKGIPFSHAGVIRLGGQTMTVVPGQSACYRCIFSAPPPEDAVHQSSTIGILGAVAGTIGTIQATECIKHIAQFGRLLTDTLLTFDGVAMEFRRVPVRRRPACRACGKGNDNE
ncbi:MAG: HesA/MoeB/ThiF family protein [Chitinivibrionales bacterium]